MTSEEKVIASLQKQLKKNITISLTDHLRDNLGMDSMNLVELTILIHTEYGVDLGRKAVELKIIPETVADIVNLVDA